MQEPYAHLMHDQSIAAEACEPCERITQRIPNLQSTYIPARYRDRSGTGALTLTIGIVSMILWPFGLVAIAIGLIGFAGAGKPRPKGWGMAVAGMTLGAFSTAFCLLIVAEIVARHHG